MSIYRKKSRYLREIRNYFETRDFIEIYPPSIVPSPGMDTHVHPFELFSLKDQRRTGTFLHTSPEFFLKQVLSEKKESKIFSLTTVFRDDPKSEIHSPNFMMLEWYRIGKNYEDLIGDIKNLIEMIREKSGEMDLEYNDLICPKSFSRRSVDSLFQEFAGFSILEFTGDTHGLEAKIRLDLPQVPLSKNCEWDDLFFLVFLNLIEPHFELKFPYLIVEDYPAAMAALSELNPKDNRVSQRFELYLSGIEVANCYHELIGFTEQESRFFKENEQKKKIYGYELPYPKVLMNSLKNGLPSSSGGAMGVERLAMALNNLNLLY